MNPFNSLLLLLCLLLMIACGDSTDTNASQAPVIPTNTPATTPVIDPAAATPPPPPPATEPAQNAAGIWHYTCNNGCAGGAGSAVACAKCGSTLAHNTAYHGQSPASTAPSVTPSPAQATGGTPPSMFTDPTKKPVNATVGRQALPTQTADPAQNAAGIWHYTCSNGCAGGAGSEIACTKCGSTLVHNTAYHQ